MILRIAQIKRLCKRMILLSLGVICFGSCSYFICSISTFPFLLLYFELPKLISENLKGNSSNLFFFFRFLKFLGIYMIWSVSLDVHASGNSNWGITFMVKCKNILFLRVVHLAVEVNLLKKRGGNENELHSDFSFSQGNHTTLRSIVRNFSQIISRSNAQYNPIHECSL